MRWLVFPALAAAAVGCVSSGDIDLLHREITDVSRQVENLSRQSPDKEALQVMNRKLADQSAQVLKSNADIQADLQELRDQIQALQANLEATSQRLASLSNELAATRERLGGLPMAPAALPTGVAAGAALPVPGAPAPGRTAEPAQLYNAAYEDYLRGNFDLAIDNRKNLSNTPWTYYNYLFRLPISERQLDENFARYDNPEAWALVEQLDQTPVDDPEGLKAVMSDLQLISLSDLPAIPLWYNGAWSQVSSAVWSNWPSADGLNYLPVTWNGYWQMGGMRWLAALEHPAVEG